MFAGAGYLFYQWRAGGRPPDPVATGQTVLAAKFMGLDNQPQALGQWRGKVLVVNFLGDVVCAMPRGNPVLIRFQDQYSARGCSSSASRSTRKSASAPTPGYRINYPVLIGGLESMDFARQVGNSRVCCRLPWCLTAAAKS